MIRRFPREHVRIERTRLRYIDLDSVLSDGKAVRASRVPGFVALFSGDEIELIFLLEGEPVTAARYTAAGAEIVPIAAAIERAEADRAHADVGFYGAPDIQLRAMLAPAVAPSDRLYSTPDLIRPRRLFQTFTERRVDGVLEVREEDAAIHYLTFAGGELSDARVADRAPEEPPGEALKRLFRPPRRARLGAALYPALSEVPVQAPPALIELYRRTLVSAVSAVCAALGGEEAGLLCFDRARARSLEHHPVLAGCRIEPDLTARVETVATAEELTDGVARWLFEVLSAAQRNGGIEPAELLAPVTRRDRHALEAQGFFAGLPWPVPA